MSEIANVDLLLKALRQVGVDVPDKAPTTLRDTSHPYWYITCGCFDTMVDKRDAETEDDALIEAFSPLQPWHAHKSEEINSIKQVTRNEYVDWLRRGVK